jgi:O-antigen ligase
MNRNLLLSRIIALGFWAIITGFIIHIRHARMIRIGRETYLARRGAFYDHFYAHPHSIIVQIIAGFILIGFLCVLYELVAFIALKIIEEIDKKDSSSQPGPAMPA